MRQRLWLAALLWTSAASLAVAPDVRARPRRPAKVQGQPRPDSQPVEPLMEACDQGVAEGCHLLARRYQREGQTELARINLRKACKMADQGACAEQQKAAAEPPDGRERDCSGGDGAACYQLGQELQGPAGKPDPGDVMRVVALYDQACAAGERRGCAAGLRLLYSACEDRRDSAACGALGQRLMEGKAAPRDPAAGQRYLQRACSGGHAPACRQLRRPDSDSSAAPPTYEI